MVFSPSFLSIPPSLWLSLSLSLSLLLSLSLSGKFFWRVQHSGSLLSFIPALIENFWIGLPPTMERIDTVYERANGNIVFFIGKERQEVPLPYVQFVLQTVC